MFRVGECVLLRPVSIHDTDYISQSDTQILLNTRQDPSGRVFSWFVNDYIDWTTACFLSKPVMITISAGLRWYIAPENGLPQGKLAWAFKECMLMPLPQPTISRRLTVIGKQE